MDEERMKNFLKEIKKQREEEYCKRGHYFEGDDACKNCGKMLTELFQGVKP